MAYVTGIKVEGEKACTSTHCWLKVFKLGGYLSYSAKIKFVQFRRANGLPAPCNCLDHTGVWNMIYHFYSFASVEYSPYFKSNVSSNNVTVVYNSTILYACVQNSIESYCG